MKHHYIPQFYLRPWLGDDHKLQEYRRGYKGRIQTGRYGTLSTGFEGDLYVIPGVTEDTKHNVERFFMSFVDNAAVRARDMMLNDKIPQDAETRHSWARFVMSLIFRNPEEMAKFKARFTIDYYTPNEVFTAKYEAIRQPGDPETFEEWILNSDPTGAERQAVITMTKLIEHPNALKLLRRMHWMVLDSNKVARKFMTSDRPTIMTNGLIHYTGHYALPISPTRLFIACTTVQFAEEIAKAPMSRIVRKVNETVIGQGRKYVYALDDTHTAEVRKMMGKKEGPSFAKVFRTSETGKGPI